MQHIPRSTSAMWFDMFIKTTFMRFSHSTGGLTGITLNENAANLCVLIVQLVQNCQDAIRLGKFCMEHYMRKLPDGFHDTITSPVTAMDVN